MHASEMWKTSTGRGITVAVIDSGVNAGHPDLAGKVLPGKDFSAQPGGATSDAVGHGTGMASLIVGTGKGDAGQGMLGLAPGAKILPLRVKTQGGANEAELERALDSEVAQALHYAANSDAQIVNMSLGIPDRSQKVQAAVDYALSRGKLIIASAGNDGKNGNPVEYPAAYPGVVGVSAIDRTSTVASWSEHGKQVALAAPGADMVNACDFASGYCNANGTSDSAAIVSASAALVWAVHRDWTADQVLRVLMNTAGKPDSGNYSQYLGYGIVRPRIALTAPGDPGPADVNPLLAGSSSPASAPASGAASATAAASPGGGAAPSGKPSQGSGGLLWIAVGVAGLAVLGGGAAAAVVWARRRKAAAQASPGVPHGQAPHPQNPYGQNPYGQNPYGQNPYAQNPYAQQPSGPPPSWQPEPPKPPQGPYPPQQPPHPPEEYQGGSGPRQ